MNFLLSGSVPLGRFFGIHVRLHILFLLYIAFSLYDSKQEWRDTAIFLTMLFGTVLVHEFGHCFGARAVGGFAENILLWPLGGLAFAHAPMRPWPQFVTVAAGPLVNVIFCVISGAVLIIATGRWDVIPLNPIHPAFGYLGDKWRYVALFYVINLRLLAFNLLPIFPMDGGQLFRTIIWPYMGLQRATVVSAQLGLLGAVLLGVWGIQGGGGGMLIYIAIFGGLTCWQHLQAARYGGLREDIGSYDYVARSRPPRRSVWSRLFGRRMKVRYPAEREPTTYVVRDIEPAGESARLEAEVDRILKKVGEQGIESLTYVERQTLERATRIRQERGL